MLPQIKKHLKENWEQFFINEPESIQLLLLSNPQGKKITHGKCTVLIFINNEKTPVLVCKFLRTKNAVQEKLTKEHVLLEQLSWAKSPRAVDLILINERYVSFEQFLPGESLKSELAKKVNRLEIKNWEELSNHIERDFKLVSELLLDFRDSISDDISEVNTYFDRAVKNKLIIYNALGLSETEKGVLDGILAEYEREIPKVKLCHLDLTPSNVLKQNDELKLIDFEFSEYSRHTFLDPFRFIFYYFQLLFELSLLQKDSYEHAFYYLFIESEEFKGIVHGFLDSVIDGYRYELFLKHMSLFLLSNVQLQMEETEFQDEQFIRATKNLLVILMDTFNGKQPDLDKYKQLKLESTYEELLVEVASLKKEVINYQQILLEKEKQHTHNVNYIEQCHNTIEQKDTELKENIKYIEQCHNVIKQKDKDLEENVKYIEKCHQVIAEKDNYLVEIEGRITESYQAIATNEKVIEKNNSKITSMEEELRELNKINKSKDDQIKELEFEVNRSLFWKIVKKLRKR